LTCACFAAGDTIEAFGHRWRVPVASDWKTGVEDGAETLELLVPRPSTQPRRPVQYALAGDPASVRRYGYWKRDLTEADLDIDSPYNTYVHVGLPPGPIANPGLDSIRAVLKPLQTNFLFFVAKPDGTHAFAATLEEHQRNVDQYQGGSP
jgi:hypothetical protein